MSPTSSPMFLRYFQHPFQLGESSIVWLPTVSYIQCLHFLLFWFYFWEKFSVSKPFCFITSEHPLQLHLLSLTKGFKIAVKKLPPWSPDSAVPHPPPPWGPGEAGDPDWYWLSLGCSSAFHLAFLITLASLSYELLCKDSLLPQQNSPRTDVTYYFVFQACIVVLLTNCTTRNESTFIISCYPPLCQLTKWAAFDVGGQKSDRKTGLGEHMCFPIISVR